MKNKTEPVEILGDMYHYNFEIAIGNLIAKKYPEYTHMINTRYEGGDNLYLDFLDPDATYQQEVADYVKELINEYCNP